MLEAKFQRFEDNAFKRGEMKGELKVLRALLKRGMTREEIREVTELADKELDELESSL